MVAFGICWDDHMVLAFILLMCHTYWFAYIKSSLHSMMNPTCSLCMILLMCCWIHFANVLLRISACIFNRDIDLYFSFLMIVLSGFGIRIGWPCKMSLGIFSPLQFFGRVCEGFTSETIWAYLAFSLLGGYWCLTLISLWQGISDMFRGNSHVVGDYLFGSISTRSFQNTELFLRDLWNPHPV